MAKKKDNINITDKQISTYAKALGHPTRVAIMQFLLSQESCYFGDIHDVFPNAKATVSQHLKELRNAGLIQGEIETPKVKYCINKENWEIASKLFGEFFSSKIKNNC
ncbi:MAG TPA: transcriptional regulator [Porphyromonadaceae bacterium]|nr:transcriptional regulator [Porphyromonadaceae bacterium]